MTIILSAPEYVFNVKFYPIFFQEYLFASKSTNI